MELQDIVQVCNRAEKGDVNAQLLCGRIYYNGTGVRKDYKEALKWYKKAAWQGNVEAMTQVGLMLYKGEGTDHQRKFYNSALQYLKDAAKKGDLEAKNWLENEVVRDAEVINRLKAEAEKGDEKSQYECGMIYYRGEKAAYSLKEALNWFKKAAEQGHREAQYMCGELYHQGEGKINDKEALKWYEKSAKQGHREAQYMCGELYSKGESVKHDHKKALKWYKEFQKKGGKVDEKKISKCKTALFWAFIGALLIIALGACCLKGGYGCIWNSDFVMSNIVPELGEILCVIAGIAVAICIFIHWIYCILIILVACGINVILDLIIIPVIVVKLVGVTLLLLGVIIVLVGAETVISIIK